MTSAIPKELRALCQWVRWKVVEREGNPTKPPFHAIRNGAAKSTDPGTWSTYHEANNNRDRHGMAGIGFVFAADDPYTGVDLDHCRDPESGAIESWARKWVARLDSYTEVSPSGDGLHIIVRAGKPGDKCRKSKVEVYDQGRYFTMTGEHLPGTPATVEDRQAELEEFYREMLDQPKESKPRKPAPQVVTFNDNTPDHDALIEKMCASNEGAARLWAGDDSSYDSPSEAVGALCCHLAFWTDHDQGSMDTLFRQSGLFRDQWVAKWERLSEQEICRACDLTTEGYTHRAPAGDDQGETAPPWGDIPPPTDDDAPPELAGAPDGTTPDNTKPWPEPEPLRRELPPGDPYPVDALPRVLRGAADQMSGVIRAPVGIVGSALLGAASLTVQAHADAVIDGRTIPLSLFLATVAESGERKSAVDDAALAPHRARQKALIRAHDEEVCSHLAEHAAWTRAREEALRSHKGSVLGKRQALEELGPEPPSPIRPLLECSEPTYEGLIKQLEHGWPSVGLFSDEGGRFLGGHAWSKDHQIKTATGLSELWQGRSVNRVRGGDGASILYGRRVALHLMLQPSLLPLLFGDAMLAGQGFLARLLLAYPASTIGTRAYRPVNLSQTPEMRRYFGRMMTALEAPLPLAEDQRNELAPRRLELAPAALQKWITYHNHMERQQAPGGKLAQVRADASKTAEQATRIAGVLALVEDLSVGTIKVEYMEAGIELARYHLGETMRLALESKDDPDLELAEIVLEWGRACGGRFPAVDLYQRGPARVRDRKTAGRIMGILVDHGRARSLPRGTMVDGKPRRNAWEVQP